MDPIKLAEYEMASLEHIADGIAGTRLLFVNIFAISHRGGWTLIDAGLPMSAGRIRSWAEGLFGEDTAPEAIVLTHGHFDHVGALKELAEEWDVPVYASSIELPYITGQQHYPAPDPTVGGGMMAWMSPLYPRGPIDIGGRAHALPQDGSVPTLEEWRWIATPGHAPGHVSFYRERDKVLLAGDAFCTTNQESFFAVMQQRPELQGPPTYYTPDWNAARASVERLAALQAEILAPSHGRPMHGPDATAALDKLARDFTRIAMPEHGRYVPASS